MKLIKLIMPSQGDMEIVRQEGGTILLKPTYFGGECAGPIVQFVDAEDIVSDGKASITETKVETSFRIKIKKDGDLKIARAD